MAHKQVSSPPPERAAQRTPTLAGAGSSVGGRGITSLEILKRRKQQQKVLRSSRAAETLINGSHGSAWMQATKRGLIVGRSFNRGRLIADPAISFSYWVRGRLAKAAGSNPERDPGIVTVYDKHGNVLRKLDPITRKEI